MNITRYQAIQNYIRSIEREWINRTFPESNTKPFGPSEIVLNEKYNKTVGERCKRSERGV